MKSMFILNVVVPHTPIVLAYQEHSDFLVYVRGKWLPLSLLGSFSFLQNVNICRKTDILFLVYIKATIFCTLNLKGILIKPTGNYIWVTVHRIILHINI